MDGLIDFGSVVAQTRHGGHNGEYWDPVLDQCTDHDDDEYVGCPVCCAGDEE